MGVGPVVVLGASGGIGGAVARELAARGHRVRAVGRTRPGGLPEGVEGHAADLATPDGALRACAGAAVVVHCAQPPCGRRGGAAGRRRQPLHVRSGGRHNLRGIAAAAVQPEGPGPARSGRGPPPTPPGGRRPGGHREGDGLLRARGDRVDRREDTVRRRGGRTTGPVAGGRRRPACAGMPSRRGARHRDPLRARGGRRPGVGAPRGARAPRLRRPGGGRPRRAGSPDVHRTARDVPRGPVPSRRRGSFRTSGTSSPPPGRSTDARSWPRSGIPGSRPTSGRWPRRWPGGGSAAGPEREGHDTVAP